MLGLDPKVAVHHLSVKKGARPVKQGQCIFRPELIPLIETEVNKLIEVGFIREVKYPMWISSIIPVTKKNGQIRVCVDFRDLKNACPKDDFPLPIAELMIDATRGHEALSFMDGSSGYNQIRMAPVDEELTAFRTPKVEKREDHLYDLRKGIEIQQAKIDAILKMPEPRNIHELKSLQGKLAYLRMFISNLAGRCQPFSRLMKKEVPFEWDEACDKAFKSIKSYLMKPPFLVAPVHGRPLILYVAAQQRLRRNPACSEE
ncbi:UNVERIFIED_CONTAM: Transposon Tf2-12 polyprotein [Sesamum latifolium]|uniref:Transposon Tf2-12 polyprotein n=1 Tax=Sesamum latifolium TaxID=2727402 RepID=A0AAW2U6H3_9LAMI